MIKIDFVSAIALFLSFSLFLVFTLWIFYTWSEKLDSFNQIKNLQQCPYCTYIFFAYRETELKVCPQCKSYLSLNNAHSNKAEENPTT